MKERVFLVLKLLYRGLLVEELQVSNVVEILQDS
jgi:hypothetical protein